MVRPEAKKPLGAVRQMLEIFKTVSDDNKLPPIDVETALVMMEALVEMQEQLDEIERLCAKLNRRVNKLRGVEGIR